jgi:hypothetical protein
MKAGRGEAVAMGLAVALFAGMAWESAGRFGWGSYPIFLPMGLLVLTAANVWLRSRVLAWGVFTLAFVFLVTVLGAFVIQMRTIPDLSWIPFLRALALYAALAMTGLFQLRGGPSAARKTLK